VFREEIVYMDTTDKTWPASYRFENKEISPRPSDMPLVFFYF